MNRQRDAEGENASRVRSDEEGVEAEAGSLGRQLVEGEKAKGEGMWQRQASSLHPLVFYLSRGEP